MHLSSSCPRLKLKRKCVREETGATAGNPAFSGYGIPALLIEANNFHAVCDDIRRVNKVSGRIN